MPPLTNSSATSTDLHRRRGVVYGASAYIIWGAFPTYWPLLVPATAAEILAHRIAWAMLIMIGAVTALGKWRGLTTLSARHWLAVSAASVLVTANWGTYIHAVNTQHVVESALRYFINPLVSVVLGVAFLKERLNRSQLSSC